MLVQASSALDLAIDGVRSVYQPIVDLASGATVAWEALARGPEGPFQYPDQLFAAAADAGRTAELDWRCRSAALRGAIRAGLTGAHALFVNVESSTLGIEAPSPDAQAAVEEAAALRVVLELTERDLTRCPADLLATVAWARRRWWGIALDDVGINPESLALMPLIRPDVVKYDRSMLRHPSAAEQGRIAAAVMAYAEETGATILGEGIENERDERTALALGATLGQGWHYGRPGELRPGAAPTATIDLLASGAPDLAGTPFTRAGAGLPVRTATKAELLAMSLHIESQVTALPTPPILLGAFQRAERFTPATACRYAGYAAASPLVGALAAGIGTEPAPGVRGATLAVDDALVDEWAVVVVGPHFAAALLARDLGDTGADRDRRFDYVVTHDRTRVILAAQLLTASLVARAG